MRDVLIESFLTSGMYAAFIPDKVSLNLIQERVNALKDIDKIDVKLYPKEEYHTTVVYSKFNGALVKKETNRISPKIATHKVTSKATSVAVYGKFLVLQLEDCPVLFELYNHFASVGAKSDYPVYMPHISIGKFSSIEAITPEVINIVNNMTFDLRRNPFTIKYTKIYSDVLKDND